MTPVAPITVKRVDDDSVASNVHEMAASLIVGYSADGLETADRRRGQILRGLFDPTAVLPDVTTILIATDGLSIFGAAIMQCFVSEELAELHPEIARQMATTHVVLSGMFVVPQARRYGVGAKLIREATALVVHGRGRYLDGFVDERNGSADFYRAVGAQVGVRNEGLPERQPTRVSLAHPGNNGHWFYFDCWRIHQSLMQCSRCGDQLIFVEDNGGHFRCAVCMPQ